MEDIVENPLFLALFNSPVPRIIVAADAPVFTIITSNDAHKQVTNLVGKNIVGRSVWEIFDPNESGGNGGTLLREALTEAQEGNATVLMPPFRYDMGGPDGACMVEKWWQLEIMPVGKLVDRPQYLITTTNDITERVFREKQTAVEQQNLELLVEERTAGLVGSEAKFRSLVEQSPIAISLLTGEDMILEAVNFQMLRLWGMEDAQIRENCLNHYLGKTLSEIAPGFLVKFREVFAGVIASGKGQALAEVSYFQGEHESPADKYARIFFDPVKSLDGQITGVFISAVDISEAVHGRRELERTCEQVTLSKQAAQFGTFDMDARTGDMVWDDRCRELFGIFHGRPVTYAEHFLGCLHPDDLQRVKDRIAELFTLKRTDGVYDIEYRTVGLEDKKIRWVRAKGKLYLGRDGRPLRLIGSVLDITDKKREDQFRNDFLAVASHELKTPLTSLLGYLQLFHRRALTNGDTVMATKFEQAEKQVLKMRKLINIFMDLSLIEAGKLQLEVKKVSLLGIIMDAVADINTVSPDAALLVKGDDVEAFVDRDKLEHVVLNLLSNAVKYSKPCSEIIVSLSSTVSDVSISVRDQGMGIPAAKLQKLFERFYRIRNENTKYISGFGIGLYMCRELVELHGGKITVESEFGTGSVFTVTLPVEGRTNPIS
jgi:signal transduction histidine kinase